MKIKALCLLLLVSIKYNIQSLDKSLLHEKQLPYSSKKSLDKKARFIPKRMTDGETQRLSTFIKQNLQKAKKNNDDLLINAYERITAILKKLTSQQLSIDSLADEKKYTDYFNLIIYELKALGINPQLILQTTNLRQQLLEGKLEKKLWFVQEIEGLIWLFENDAKQAAFNQELQIKKPSPLNDTQQQWPNTQDKALYIISLIDQIERNYQRVETEDLATIMQTCEQYLTAFLPDLSAVLQRIAQEALNKLNKIRNIRDIPLLKE